MAKEKGAVVVTGASTGIGRATALHLDERGYRVFAGVRKKADADSLKEEGSERLTPVTIDVAKQRSIDAARQKIQRAVGKKGLAGLVNNAGIANAGPVEHLPVDEFQKVIDVNLVGQYAVTQAFLPLLRRGGGDDRLHHLDRRPRRLALLLPLQRGQVRPRGDGRLAAPRAQALEGDERRRGRAGLDRHPDLGEGQRQLRRRLEARWAPRPSASTARRWTA